MRSEEILCKFYKAKKAVIVKIILDMGILRICCFLAESKQVSSGSTYSLTISICEREKEFIR